MPVWEEIDDAQLLKLAQSGHVDAFGELYERYATLIYRFIYAHVFDRLDAEDLTEEVFFRVLRALPNYREQGVPFAAYLYHIARNVLIDHHRRSKFSSKELQLGDGEVLSHLTDAEIETPALQTQELQERLGQLRADYRDVLVLRFLSDFSPEETAQIMERSVGAIRVLQHRALTALRKLFVGDQESGKSNGHG